MSGMLSARHQEILDTLASYGPLNGSKIARYMGIHTQRSGICGALRHLAAQGLVRSISAPNAHTNVYALLQNPEDKVAVPAPRRVTAKNGKRPKVPTAATLTSTAQAGYVVAADSFDQLLANVAFLTQERTELKAKLKVVEESIKALLNPGDGKVKTSMSGLIVG